MTGPIYETLFFYHWVMSNIISLTYLTWRFLVNAFKNIEHEPSHQIGFFFNFMGFKKSWIATFLLWASTTDCFMTFLNKIFIQKQSSNSRRQLKTVILQSASFLFVILWFWIYKITEPYNFRMNNLSSIAKNNRLLFFYINISIKFDKSIASQILKSYSCLVVKKIK